MITLKTREQEPEHLRTHTLKFGDSKRREMFFFLVFLSHFPEDGKQGCFDDFLSFSTLCTLGHFSSFVILCKNLVRLMLKMQLFICGFLLYADL